MIAQPRPTPTLAPTPAPTPAFAPAPVHDARNLTGGGATASILLNGQVYALRITRAGKLILTK